VKLSQVRRSQAKPAELITMNETERKKIYKELSNSIDEYIEQIKKINEESEVNTDMFIKEIDENIIDETVLMKKYNLLNKDVKEKYMKPINVQLNNYLSPILSTTSNLTGQLSNLVIDERDINRYKTNSSVVLIKSNYGKLIDPTYEKYFNTVEVKSTRGRKPKERPVKKERKKQGNGDCFQSQITFVVLGDMPNSETKSGKCEYSIKVFRNAKEQIPGCIPSHLDDILSANEKIIQVLNNSHVSEFECNKIQLESVCIKMKNYKFHIKLKKNCVLNLKLLKYIFELERIKDELKGESI